MLTPCAGKVRSHCAKRVRKCRVTRSAGARQGVKQAWNAAAEVGNEKVLVAQDPEVMYNARRKMIIT